MPPETADGLSTYLYDPSPSLIAAKLVGALAEALDLKALSPHSLYLTGENELIHPHLQTFVVEQELPLDVRKLRGYLQAGGVGRLEIKKRGVDMTPEILRPQLELCGEHSTTLILTRIGSNVRAIICRRI